MASYTYTQLYGTGSAGENLSGLKTFTFNNPSASSYFVMETNRNPSGFYDSGSFTNFRGTYSVSSSTTLISSSYITSMVVPPGRTSFRFTPSYTLVSGSNYRLRGTGMYSLTVS